MVLGYLVANFIVWNKDKGELKNFVNTNDTEIESLKSQRDSLIMLCCISEHFQMGCNNHETPIVESYDDTEPYSHIEFASCPNCGQLCSHLQEANDCSRFIDVKREWSDAANLEIASMNTPLGSVFYFPGKIYEDVKAKQARQRN
jgi:transcription elongation factor Elf1